MIAEYFCGVAADWFSFVVCVCAVSVAVTFVRDFFRNVYASDVKSFSNAKKALKKCGGGEPLHLFSACLPVEYLDQWKCFAKSKAFASEIFEFRSRQAKKTDAVYLMCFVCAALYLAAFVLDKTPAYLLFSFCAVVALCLLGGALKAKARADKKRAENIFFSLVTAMDVFFENDYDFDSLGKAQSDKAVDDVIKRFDLLKSLPEEQAMEKAARILRADSLRVDRTVAQQQRLNLALNDLITKV